jgi:hypothetical protein
MRIKHFLTPKGKVIAYDSSDLVIKHDNETGEYSWWLSLHYYDPGTKLTPVYEREEKQ